MTALGNGRRAPDVCLIAPAGERQRFVDRHAPEKGNFEVGVDFQPRTYAELIELHDQHPERKFADANGDACSARTRGLLHDLPVRVAHVKHVGKEGNELEAHKAGIIDESERQVGYHDTWFEDLVAIVKVIPTKVVAEATGYNDRTVRRLKRGEFRPSRGQLSKLLSVIVTN
jgi:hypothetical protein